MSLKSVKLASQECLERGIYPIINEGFKLLEENIVEAEEDIDLALILGAGFPPCSRRPSGLWKIQRVISCKRKTGILAQNSRQPLSYFRKTETRIFKRTYFLRKKHPSKKKKRFREKPQVPII